MSESKQLYEGSTYEAFASFIEATKKGESAIFTDTETGQKLFTESALNSEVISVLDEIKAKGRWDTPEAQDLPYSTRKAVDSIRSRYE